MMKTIMVHGTIVGECPEKCNAREYSIEMCISGPGGFAWKAHNAKPFIVIIDLIK